jgi:hypothetical protein
MKFSRTLRAGIALVLATSAIACGQAEELGNFGGTNSDGSCVDCAADDSNGFEPGYAGDDDASCAVVKAEFEPVTPTVVLVVDQSGSMTSEYADGESRWDALYGALMSPTDGVVKALESDVQFGLALYTSYDGFDGGECPSLTEVGSQFGNHADINAAYAAAEPQDDTPTGASIVAVADALEAQDVAGPKIIIVATDGEPDTCTEPDPQNGQQEAIDGAAYAYGKGIRTFVLGVGRDVSSEHLQDMANAGAGLAIDGELAESFFQPSTRQELVDAFGGIIEGQRSCVLPLDGEIDPDNVSGEVTVDGEVVPMGDDGWKARDANHIELVGAACEAVMAGDHEVAGTFYCDASAPAATPR